MYGARKTLRVKTMRRYALLKCFPLTYFFRSFGLLFLLTDFILRLSRSRPLYRAIFCSTKFNIYNLSEKIRDLCVTSVFS